jgi:hypothetical protein
MLLHLVSVCCNRCCSPRALTHGQACAAPGVLAPSGVVPYGGACSRLLPPSLSQHARYALFRIGVCAPWSPLSLVCSYGLSCIGASALCSLSVSYNCAPSHIRVREMCSLSHMQLTKQKETWGAQTAGGGACSKKSKRRRSSTWAGTAHVQTSGRPGASIPLLLDFQLTVILWD